METETNDDNKLKVLDKISTVQKSDAGYSLCFAQVSRGGRRPRIDLRYIGPQGQAGSGVALDGVDLLDLLRALQEAIDWQEDNVAF